MHRSCNRQSLPNFREPDSFAACARVVLCLICLGSIGCKRGFYLRTADRDAYCLIQEKGAGPSWTLQPGFNVTPDPRSRFYDPTCKTDPTLPIPAPQIYNYDVPPLVTEAPAPRDLNRNTTDQTNPNVDSTSEDTEPAAVSSPSDRNPSEPNSGNTSSANSAVGNLESTTLQDITTTSELQATSFAVYVDDGPSDLQLQGTDPAASPAPERLPIVVAAMVESGENSSDKPGDDQNQTSDGILRPSLLEPLGQTPLPRLGAVPQDAWLSLPETCLKRMLEFDTVRAEYERSFNRPVDESQLDAARRVNLENILEIALINSRDYQTRKETLYRVALRLSLQRFAYETKFLSRGNGASLGYTHDRNLGIENNSLSIQNGVGLSKSLYTGGDFIARFANDVVLTFNGPAGFSSSVGSEIFVDLFQPILQRDVRFEALTQAERDVVYAARDFVRIRKLLFRDLAAQYYALLLTYRGIAINTQDYFSNLREFNRAAATERAGRIPLFQVDQFEQNVLRSRGNLINSCNSLEGSIDRLKIRIGLPTELPLNIALQELEDLTQSDEANVLREQLARKSRVFLQQQEREGTAVAIPALTEVARRLLSLAEVNERIEEADQAQTADLTVLVALLETEEKRIEASKNEALLDKNSRAGDNEAQVLPAQLFIRNKEVLKLTLDSLRQELLLLKLVSDQSPNQSESPEFDRLTDQWYEQVQQYDALEEELVNVPFAQQAASLPILIAKAQQLLSSAKKLDQEIQTSLKQAGITLAQNDADLERLVEAVFVARNEVPTGSGLTALDVDMDEAMLTALVQRLDLMNQRGDLADSWRLIKYAGDDLRSILNLRTTQSIRTPPGSNKPFDFSFKDSTTRLSVDFDTPLNRRSERNIFRLALIDYNVTLRNLIDVQDNIKLDIRDDLRAIELDRNQYDIAIASAALAYDRVTSTRMQVALGQGNVTARDFLEAQQAYTQSLSAVAQQHINYINDRINFFVDVEQLQVDPVNFWPELRNEEYPFIPNTDFPSVSPNGYDTLPCGPWYSRRIRRMEQIPSGQATSIKPIIAPPPTVTADELIE